MSRRCPSPAVRPAVPLVLLACWLAAPCGCSEEEQASTLSGSIGELRSLAFDDVEVRIFRPAAGQPAAELSIQYVDKDTGEKPAVLVVDLEGLSLRSGTRIDLSELLPSGRMRGTCYWTANGQHFHELEAGRATLELESWSGKAGAQVGGSFHLVLADAAGRNLKGTFAGKLQETIWNR